MREQRKKLLVLGTTLGVCGMCLLSSCENVNTSERDDCVIYNSKYIQLRTIEQDFDGSNQILVDDTTGCLYYFNLGVYGRSAITPIYREDGTIKNIKDYEGEENDQNTN